MTNIIITGVDDSQPALRAAEQAANLAAGLGAELYVVSAFNISMGETFESVRGKEEDSSMADTLNNLSARHASEAERTVSTVADKLRLKFPRVKINSRAVEGAPGTAIVREAEQMGADIVVVGNKRVQGPVRILGSIARTIASEINCDLYVVNTHPR